MDSFRTRFDHSVEAMADFEFHDENQVKERNNLSCVRNVLIVGSSIGVILLGVATGNDKMKFWGGVIVYANGPALLLLLPEMNKLKM